MSESCTVVIGAREVLAALGARASAMNGGGELLSFSDEEPLRALDTITRRKPGLVALERLFAVTPRGVALINRIKSDASLRDSEIRVLEHNTDYMRVVPRPAAAAEPDLDQRGTRRAPRIRMAERVTVVVDAKIASLIDLSTVGAQVLCTAGLKPNQRTEVAFNDGVVRVKCAATVIWTAYEESPAGPRFRAGLDFAECDASAIDSYAQRHKA